MSNFKTQAEIYQALLDGKKIRWFCFNEDKYVYLKEGITRNNYDGTTSFFFDTPKEWSEYMPPKETKSIKVYGFVELDDGSTFTSDMANLHENIKGRIARYPKLDDEITYEE